MIRLKFTLLTLLFLSSALTSFGQGWEKELSSIPRNILPLENDNFIIAKGIFSAGLMKIDGNGEIIWDTNFSYNSEDYYENFTNLNLIQTSDDGFLMVGRRRVTSENTAIYVARFDSLGSVLWGQHYDTAPLTAIDYAMDAIEVENGNFLVLGRNDVDGGSFELESEIILLKIDGQGNQIWKKAFNLGPGEFIEPGGIIKHPESGYIILGLVDDHPDGLFRLFGIDNDGNETWSSFVGEINGNGSATNYGLLTATADGGYAIAAKAGNLYTPSLILLKTDAQGIEQWAQTLIPPSHGTFIGDLELAPDGGFLLSGADGTGEYGGEDGFLIKTDANGVLEWKRNYGGPFDDFTFSFAQLSQGGYMLCGRKSTVSGSGGQLSRGYLVKTDDLGYLFRNQIKGNVFEDLDMDCAEIPEAGLQDWYIELSNETQTYFDVTDSLGNYAIAVDTGHYDLTVHPVSPYWAPCEVTEPVSVSLFDTLTINKPVQTETECPYLLVDISTPFLRRCFDNQYTIRYCNAGTVPAEDAYIEVELDEYLTFNSATVPLESQEGNLYRFNVGQVEVGECDRFKINVTVDCDSTELGQTHCVQANIYPDTLCIPTPGWSGASIELDASCTGDSVIFTIKNVGTAPTTPDLDYLVIEDEVILFQDEFTLGIGESINIGFAASGTTFRMEAEQEPNHPGDDDPSVTVEGCGAEGNQFSVGFVNQFLENDGNPFVSIDCQENVGSWDPNDKRAFPKGYGENHFIEANTDIEYHIRFQNTGTDTAFTIVVRDPLSENLDITSVRPGASSHPYTFGIGPNRTLEFTFNDIMLPDSNVNEVASHGFVKFKVSQVSDLPDGERIFNGAAIYFDFNEPIFTNSTYHLIGREYITTSVVENKYVTTPAKVFPNPFKEQATFELSNINPTQEIQFYLMDLQGRTLRRSVSRGSTFNFHRGALPKGIYLYRIENEGKIINAGKIITQ